MSQVPSSFFVAPPQEPHSPAPVRRNIKAVFVFLVSAAYGMFIFFILGKQLHAPLFGMIALYAYGLLGGLGLLLVHQFYTGIDRSRQILGEVLEKSAEAHLITDPDGSTIYSNERFLRLTGGRGGDTLEDFAHAFQNAPEISATLQALREKAAPDGTASGECDARGPARTVWLQVTCQHIAGWTGFIHWRFDDISRRHQMEVTLHEEREKLRDFTDNAPVGLFSVDEDGRFLFANGMLLRLLEITADDLIGTRSLHEFIANPPKNARPCDCFPEGGDHQHGELTLRSALGRPFLADVTHSLTHGADGRVISRSIVYDMTSERQMQQALHESEDRFERLFEEAPVGICTLNADTTINDANQTLAGMLQMSEASIKGKKLSAIVAEESRARVGDWLRRLSAGTSAESAIEVTLGGAHHAVAQLYARKFKGSERFVLHFIDLTEQKNLERRFTQSQKMQAVGQLAGGIAHDFNNLLTAMIGFADLLLLRHKPGDPSFADITQIKQNANRAANMVRQLLAFSRQQTLQPRVLDLADVLTELSHLLRRLIGTNIDLRITHGADLGLIKADQGQMEQVLVNLVVNAKDAMPQGGKLAIRTENFTNTRDLRVAPEEILPAGEWVTIAVEDTGTGIDAETLVRIFEPFFTTKDVGAGTGLGLATVHGIVHQTGGAIGVASEVGKGTTFTIYLPRHAAAEATKTVEASEEKAPVADLTGSARILLVEDEDAVRIFSARALTNKGYQVVDAPGGALALQMLEEKKIEPEVLITDVMMPEMDGTTLAKIVREKYPQIKIVFISGYAEDRFKEHLGAGVYFLPKPFTLKQLAEKVKSVIEDKG